MTTTRMDTLIIQSLWCPKREEAELTDEERLSDTEIGELIDEIMREDDLNDDGYIDYAEFISSQQRSEGQDNV